MNKSQIRIFINNYDKYDRKDKPLFFNISKSIYWSQYRPLVYKQEYF